MVHKSHGCDMINKKRLHVVVKCSIECFCQPIHGGKLIQMSIVEQMCAYDL